MSLSVQHTVYKQRVSHIAVADSAPSSLPTRGISATVHLSCHPKQRLHSHQCTATNAKSSPRLVETCMSCMQSQRSLKSKNICASCQHHQSNSTPACFVTSASAISELQLLDIIVTAAVTTSVATSGSVADVGLLEPHNHMLACGIQLILLCHEPCLW